MNFFTNKFVFQWKWIGTCSQAKHSQATFVTVQKHYFVVSHARRPAAARRFNPIERVRR